MRAGWPRGGRGDYDAPVRSVEPALVDIAREFLLAHQQLRQLFERHRRDELHWDEVQELVGGTEASVLFRLKERCHALFRAGELGGDLSAARVALFDLAIGSLFHEAMKLRENFYQLEVYAPKVERARSEAEPGAEGLFEEFARILAASRERLAEAMAESEALLEQIARQETVLPLRREQHADLPARLLQERFALGHRLR